MQRQRAEAVYLKKRALLFVIHNAPSQPCIILFFEVKLIVLKYIDHSMYVYGLVIPQLSLFAFWVQICPAARIQLTSTPLTAHFKGRQLWLSDLHG